VSNFLKNKTNNAAETPQEEWKRDSFRDLWPPACVPLAAPIIKEQGQSIPVIALLDDGSIIARIAKARINDISQLQKKMALA